MKITKVESVLWDPDPPTQALLDECRAIFSERYGFSKQHIAKVLEVRYYRATLECGHVQKWLTEPQLGGDYFCHECNP